MLKKIPLLAALGYTITLATVCLINLSDLSEVNVSNADKIFHFFAYSLFVVLWYFAFFYSFNFKIKKAIIWAFVWGVSFGVAIEFLQGSMTETRALDFYDALANTFGALITSIILWFKNSLHVKNS